MEKRAVIYPKKKRSSPSRIQIKVASEGGRERREGQLGLRGEGTEWGGDKGEGSERLLRTKCKKESEGKKKRVLGLRENSSAAYRVKTSPLRRAGVMGGCVSY